MNVTCPACGGSGDRNGNLRASDPFGTCPGCDGRGIREAVYPSPPEPAPHPPGHPAYDPMADVTVTVDLLPGDCIPDVLFAAARTAAEQAYDRKVPKLRPVVLDQHGNARPRPSTGKVSSL